MSTVVGSSSSHGRRGAGIRASTAAATNVRDHPLLVVGARILVVRVRFGRRVALPDHRGAEAQLRDPDLGRHDLVGRPSARVRRLEADQPPGPGLRDAAAGDRRVERGRDGIADDVTRVGLVRHPQRDPEVGVGPEVVLDDAGRPLRRHDQVDAEGPAALGDVDDAVDELRHLARERRELVDDEHEGRRGLGVAALLQLEEVLRLLAVEEVLAMVQLGSEARERTPHEVRAEVGHEADAVRELDAVGERRPALVVDEEERDPVGAVLRRHPEHPGLEELGLAGAGRSADEGVRPLRAEVERHRVGAALSDERLERPGALQPGQRRSGAVEDGVVLVPALHDARRVRRHVLPEEANHRHAAREVARVLHDGARVDDRSDAGGRRPRRSCSRHPRPAPACTRARRGRSRRARRRGRRSRRRTCGRRRAATRPWGPRRSCGCRRRGRAR